MKEMIKPCISVKFQRRDRICNKDFDRVQTIMNLSFNELVKETPTNN